MKKEKSFNPNFNPYTKPGFSIGFDNGYVNFSYNDDTQIIFEYVEGDLYKNYDFDSTEEYEKQKDYILKFHKENN